MKTLKRSGLVIGALALTLMTTTVLGTTAFAANANGKDNHPTQSGTEAENERQDSAKEEAENAALAEKAAVTEQEAIQIAQDANEGYTFVVDELGSENGVITYELKGNGTAGKVLEVHVDAGSGALVQESDSEQED